MRHARWTPFQHQERAKKGEPTSCSPSLAALISASGGFDAPVAKAMPTELTSTRLQPDHDVAALPESAVEVRACQLPPAAPVQPGINPFGGAVPPNPFDLDRV